MVDTEAAVVPGEDEHAFIENMKRQREAQGWSQTDLARKMVEAGWTNYNQMTVSRTEKHERPLRLGEARALSKIFNTSISVMVQAPEETVLARDIERSRKNAVQSHWKVVEGVSGLLMHVSNLERLMKEARDRGVHNRNLNESDIDENWFEDLREAYEVAVESLPLTIESAVAGGKQEFEEWMAQDSDLESNPNTGGAADGADSYHPYENITDAARGTHTPGEEPANHSEPIVQDEVRSGEHQETR